MKILVLVTKTSRILNVNPIKIILNESHSDLQGTLIKLPCTYLNSNLNMYTLCAKNSNAEVLTPVFQNMTVFGDSLLKEVTELKGDY